MIFNEVQKFKQPWIWVGLTFTGLLITVLFGIGIYKQIILGQKFGNHPMSDTGLVVASILVLGVLVFIALLFGFAKLTTVIDESGISYKFFPFQFKFYRINWNSIDQFNVMTYDPISDYGGWGIKSNKNGKAYAVSGDKGLQLRLKTGKIIMIGTRKDKELSDFITKIHP